MFLDVDCKVMGVSPTLQFMRGVLNGRGLTKYAYDDENIFEKKVFKNCDKY